jgi:F0F1-type ATP synthase assembly protein I
MSPRALKAYIAGTMLLGICGNLLDPEMTSPWMREAFLVLGMGFFGEIAILGIGAHGERNPS